MSEYSNKDITDGEYELYALKINAKEIEAKTPIIKIYFQAKFILVNHSLKMNFIVGSWKLSNFPEPSIKKMIIHNPSAIAQK